MGTVGIDETISYIVEKYGITLNKPGRATEIPDMSRDDLPELFNELGFCVGAEIGVQRGFYSEVLCKGMPRLLLYCVDPWRAYSGYREVVTQQKMDAYYVEAQERLGDLPCIFVRKTSMEAAEDFKDRSLDFVYIDANHRLPWVIDDICAWRKKVRSGGIVAGHDYYESVRKNSIIHVKHAVNCVTASFKIVPWFLVGLKAAPETQKRDKSRSWFWVEE